MVEKGLISFINTKLENDISPTHITRMLAHAGFKDSDVKEAFEYIKLNFSDSHRHAVAENDFLPPLNKSGDAEGEGAHKYSRHIYKGLFMGRLRRKDFLLGFLFFFAIGYVLLAFGVAVVSIFLPQIWDLINNSLIQDRSGLFLILIPIILAPITVMMLSLITRRLHNLGMSGVLSLLFLSTFILPSAPLPPFQKSALFIVLGVLFVLLITKKGSTSPNIYGALPASKGSFFKRIFNV